MRDSIIWFCNKTIEYSFYALLFLVPLIFTSTTSELFEFNKMWTTFSITLIIAAAWFSKMILQRRIFIQKTPLDIPIGLFVFSQIISTIFSMDQHVSLWGYYSRFNGGLFSIISYVFLYYAFVTNFVSQGVADFGKISKRAIIVSLITGVIVALWGFPSHFGYDPTCLLFRGTFDVSCWTEAFQPKVRIFSTLGQPNWMAAYLSILLPLALVYGLYYLQSLLIPAKKNYELGITNYGKNTKIILASLFLTLASLFYIDILYTRSQSGFLGFMVSMVILLPGVFIISQKERKKVILQFFGIGLIALLITFFVGSPIPQLQKYTYPGILEQQAKQTQEASSQKPPSQTNPAGPALEVGGTDSGTIRKNVWLGAIAIWKDNPLFGTGVETFAFAYYRYRPASHNLTSEWDFLYNKAHNEYLNYLATTGAFGLGSYLVMIGIFLWLCIKILLDKSLENRNLKLLILALLAGYISMLVSNFFGFSVVILNIYLFLIPAFVVLLGNRITPGVSTAKTGDVNAWQGLGIIVLWGLTLYYISMLYIFWLADNSYALGSNLAHVGQYQQGYPKLRDAVNQRPDEPVFRDELANTDAVLASAMLQQKTQDQTTGQKQQLIAQQLVSEAIETSNQLVSDYPNNINFWKSRVRIFYSLGQVNPLMLKNARDAIEKARAIAPTDAKVWYNAAVLYGQTGDTEKGIEVLKQTIKLKPNYLDAYYALGLFYHDQAVDKNGRIIHPEKEQLAVGQMHFILNNFPGDNKQVKDTLKSWGEK